MFSRIVLNTIVPFKDDKASAKCFPILTYTHKPISIHARTSLDNLMFNESV